MKAFILAAGSGTRLRPLTDTVPKCLLPIRGVALLEIWLNNCAAAGLDQVLINVHSNADQIKDFAQSYTGHVRVTVAEEEQLLGSAGTLAANRSFIQGEEDFFVLYGDVLTNVSLSRLYAFHREKRLPVTLGVYQVPDPRQCGIVTSDELGVISSFVEKPERADSNWAFSGVMVARAEIIDLIPADRPADIGFHLLPRLVGQMAAYPISSYLLDIGTLANYETAQASWPGLAVKTTLGVRSPKGEA
jgi:mannose-1-phosphate guanylyltransferase